MRWAGQRRWQLCAGIAVRRVKLGLGEEQAPGEVGAVKASGPEIGPGEVGQAEVGAAEVGADEAGPSQAGPGEVGMCQPGAGEVGPPVVRLATWNLGPHHVACLQQHRIDPFPVRLDIQLQESVGGAARHGFGRRQRAAQLTVDGAGRCQGQRCSQVPQQLMKLPHDREHGKHLRGRLRVLVPVPPSEGDLGNLLAGAEAVIYGAAREPVPSEVVMDAAPEVCSQMGTGMPGRLVDREIGRRGERRCNAAQPETPAAVSPQDAVPVTRSRG